MLMTKSQKTDAAQLFQKNASIDVEKYKQFTQDQEITTMELVDVSYHSTLCSTLSKSATTYVV